jgi:hypothetical protein
MRPPAIGDVHLGSGTAAFLSVDLAIDRRDCRGIRLDNVLLDPRPTIPMIMTAD